MGFSTDWLDLREPADHTARDPGLLARAADCLGDGQMILDLGSGTGSTARAFNGTIPASAWRFLDADEGLLSVAAHRHLASQQIVFDLKDIASLPLDGVGLITASALLDLMPIEWIEALVERAKNAGLPVYAALNYNGQMAWVPELTTDASITAAFNQHQLRDKGIGPAAGPYAAALAAELFAAQGFSVMIAESPWDFGPEHATLHGELLDGIANAAAAVGNGAAMDWLTSRRGGLSKSRVTVGHTDLLAIPPKPSSSNSAT